MMQAQQDIENVIASLKRRVKELEVENGELTAQVMQLSVATEAMELIDKELPWELAQHFTRRESFIVSMLMKRKGRVVPRAAIHAAMYPDSDVEPKIIDVFLCKIRAKMIASNLPYTIETAWGQGYALHDAKAKDAEPAPVTATDRVIRAILNASPVWKSVRPLAQAARCSLHRLATDKSYIVATLKKRGMKLEERGAGPNDRPNSYWWRAVAL